MPGQAPEIAATGFTTMIDLATDPHGNLIVLEITAHGLLAAQEGLVAGALGELAPDGTYTPLLLTGLVMPTAFAFAPEGSLIVTQNSTSGNDAQLVRVRLEARELVRDLAGDSASSSPAKLPLSDVL